MEFIRHRDDYTRTLIKGGISIVLDSSQLLQIIGLQHTSTAKAKTEESSFEETDREAASFGTDHRGGELHRNGELYRHSRA